MLLLLLARNLPVVTHSLADSGASQDQTPSRERERGGPYLSLTELPAASLHIDPSSLKEHISWSFGPLE
jgi:hypothetical protein